MPKVALCYPCITSLPRPAAGLHGENTCEENARRLAAVAHHGRLPTFPKCKIAIRLPRPHCRTRAPRPNILVNALRCYGFSIGDDGFSVAGAISGIDVPSA